MKTQELLEKWLNNEATPADMEVLNAWPDFELYKKIDRQTKRIEVPTHDISNGLKEVKERPSFGAAKKTKVRTFPMLLKIAAILVLLVVSYGYLASLPTNVNAPLAGLETIQLPDDSKITLQKNASISYKKYAWLFKRDVVLNGEAYFEVAKGKTFTVTTPEGTVQVLGTKFNVNTKDNTFVVTCYEGLVSVTFKGTTTKVRPGDSFSFGESTINNTVYTTQPSWIYNESSFAEVPLDNVFMEIEKQYNVSITTKNIDVNLRYTGSFTHKNLNDALRTITVPLHLSYSIESKHDVQIFDPKNQ